MTVLYILDYRTVGGATHSFLEMVVAMKKLGVQPIVCLGRKTDITTILKKENIPYFCAGHRTVLEPLSCDDMLFPIRYLKRYFYFWIKELIAFRKIGNINWAEIDVIHTNSARNDIGCFINKKYGIPHVMHIREFADSDFNCIAFRKNYIHVFNEYTTKFLSISEAVKRHWVGKGIVDEKVRVIYNGIHYEDISVSDDDVKRNSFRMIIAGGVYPTKGQHLAVQAIGYLPNNIRSEVSLDVVGWYDEKYVLEMKNYAITRGYESQINFLGSVNDVHERLGNYQIGLMCSRAEGFGRVTAEYMHAQLGVIASDSGANPELIQDGENGLLFKSGDAKTLADCIMKLYNDRDLLIRLSHAAKEKAEATYTQKKNAEAIFRVYKEILNV